MKLPKMFFVFIGVVQLILTAGHILLYAALMYFFLPLQAARVFWLAALILLSFTFLVSTIWDFKSESQLVRWFNILAGVWVVAWFYFLLAAAAGAIIFFCDPKLLPGSIAGWTFGLAGLLVVYGVINARVTRVIKITVNLPNLPEFWRGKTAVVASDLHLGHILRRGFARKIAGLINRQQPDILFIPGDFYDGVKTDFASLANEFKQIRAPLGIYFCSGNHEAIAGYQNCEDALKGAGIKILENEKLEIQGLQIAGIAYGQRLSDRLPDLPKLLAALQLNPARPSILLKHVPSQIAEVSGAKISLLLSGHSHHGQIWPGRLVTKMVFKGFDYGLKRFGGLWVYTSSGCGTWGPPLRLLTKAEIVKIIFG